MSVNTTLLTEPLYEYLLTVSLKEPPPLEALRRETAEHFSDYRKQSSPEQAQLMAWVVRLINAKNVIDIGTFTGYSALSLALALPEEGQVITCEIDEKPTQLAKKYWAQAGVANKIALHLAPASDTLITLLEKGLAGCFDFIFIDADKIHIDEYYEKALQLVRQEGLIAIDNVLWHGKVANPNNQDDTTQRLRLLNKKIHGDVRVDITLIPVGDGLTLARKK